MAAMRCYIGFDAWEFVKYWQDAFTKYTHKNIEMAAMRCFRAWCLGFCNILARWVYKNTRMRWKRCVAFGFDAWEFVKYWQDAFTKYTHKNIEMAAIRCFRAWCLGLCNILARWVYKNTRMRGKRCVALGFDAWEFVTYWQDAFTKYTHKNIEMAAMRCFRAWCLGFCNILARWVYKNTRMRWKRCAAISGLMLGSL